MLVTENIIEGYTLEQIANSRKFLDVYIKIPKAKRPIVEVMLTAFISGLISGMETQQTLTEIRDTA